tara:strand:- start:668 stop:2050 length:1383 start_codon:yes stop_codon:yes gene_type:complete
MGAKVEILEGIVSALADTFYELSGRLLTKTVGAYSEGSANIDVRGTHRWPATGRIAVGAMTATYSGKTNTSFTGLLDEDGNVGLPGDVQSGSVVMDIAETETQFDQLKGSFFRTTAEEDQLDMYARNMGINRLRGMSDSVFEDVLGAMVYLDAQTEYACTKILDALLGAGNYTLYEDVETFPHTVFVEIASAVSSSSIGKAFLSGGEAQPRTAPTTVDVAYPPSIVYGIYTSTDVYRTGVNYANIPLFVYTNAATPRYLRSSLPEFVPADEGKAVEFVVSGEIWSVRAYLDPITLQLGSQPRHDGLLNTGAPTVLKTDFPWFKSWMVGHQIIMSGINAVNTGVYTIASMTDEFEVVLTGGAFITETDVTWELTPNFGTAPPFQADVPRATAAGVTITAPVVIPANALVDYTTVPSAEAVVDQNQNGESQFPFYIFDETWIAQTLLDLVTAAGVQVVVEIT